MHFLSDCWDGWPIDFKWLGIWIRFSTSALGGSNRCFPDFSIALCFRDRYFTAIVTPSWLAAVPIDKTTGDTPGARNPPGIWALICISPAKPGALPA